MNKPMTPGMAHTNLVSIKTGTDTPWARGSAAKIIDSNRQHCSDTLANRTLTTTAGAQRALLKRMAMPAMASVLHVGHTLTYASELSLKNIFKCSDVHSLRLRANLSVVPASQSTDKQCVAAPPL